MVNTTTYYTDSPLETIQLGVRLGRLLRGGDVVLLFGDLGAGKTHFTKGIAEGSGITSLIKSPTYAYVNEYPIKLSNGGVNSGTDGGILYHYDLYRMESGADLTSLGYEETIIQSSAVNVVEWADRLGDHLPSRYIRVDFAEEGDARSIAIAFHYPTRLSPSFIPAYYDEFQMPLHVRAHCGQVASVAMQLAAAYVQQGDIVDIPLLYTAAMLHDLFRVCDFAMLDRAYFNEEITDEKWAKWTALREQYPHLHHADIACGLFVERGFLETAELIRLHKSLNLILEPDSYDTLEKIILYYADKRVKHSQIVSLSERFKDGRERNGKEDTPEERRLFESVEKETYILEQTLFAPLDIDPEDIV